MAVTIVVALVSTHQLVSVSADDSSATRFFEKKIRPVLVSRCYSCHSAKAGKLRGKLLLDTRAGIRRGGENGPAVVPGKPAESLLIAAMRYESFKMPPKGRLSEKVIANFVTWIEMGAPDPRQGNPNGFSPQDLSAARNHWAFHGPRRPVVPTDLENGKWPRGDLDRLVLGGLERHGLAPAAEAGRRTLIRRASYDLLGLPPTVAEIAMYLSDRKPGAFGRVVDRFLASPDFGIRWARHWLDNVRYSLDDPTCAANNNGSFSIGPYRDWVVGALNQDLPYDQFVRLQVAGDLLPVDRPGAVAADALTATGIWGLAHLVEGNDKEKILADCVDEQLDVLGRTFLGLTISCARCHDHKFDPISQQDYYALAGIFYSSHIFTFRGSARLRNRVEQPLVQSEGALYEWRVRKTVLESLESTIKTLEKKHARARELVGVRRELKALVPQPKMRPDGKKKAEIDKRVAALRKREANLLADQKKNGWVVVPAELDRWQALVAERDRLKPSVEAVVSRMVMQEGPVPGTRHRNVGDVPIFIRGDHLVTGRQIPRGIPRVFRDASRYRVIWGSGRRELALWLTKPDHPLTARVMANRIWQHLFGVGIVETPSNFGRLGRPPTNPEVLDWLAIRFVEDRWSVKSLIRQIMTSSVYRQASLSRAAARQGDPRNRWFGRMNRKRLDADALKDTLLWHRGQVTRATDDRPAGSARSLFAAPSRKTPDAFLSLFDGPDPHLVVPRRADSTSAPQALFMMNNKLVLSTAKSLATSLVKMKGNQQVSVSWLYQKLFCRLPTAEEYQLVAETLRQSRAVRRRLAKSGSQTAGEVTGTWEDLCMALLCSNEFLYID